MNGINNAIRLGGELEVIVDILAEGGGFFLSVAAKCNTENGQNQNGNRSQKRRNPHPHQENQLEGKIDPRGEIYDSSTLLLKRNERGQGKIMPLFSQFASFAVCSGEIAGLFKSLYNRPIRDRIDYAISNLGGTDTTELYMGGPIDYWEREC